MEKPQITLIPFGFLQTELPEKVSKKVHDEFGLELNFREAHLDISEFFDPLRRQYNGNSLLKRIDEQFGDDSHKTIALFNVDLFIPILTYIFGQAFLNGRSAIVSSFRLNNEHYGLKKNEKLLHERIVKEILHELGHTFGLVHCHLPDCVMRSGTYVEDIDQKSDSFCMKCRLRLNDAIFGISP